MNTQHTPGPWITETTDGGNIEITDSRTESVQIATVTQRANARLIAAAPDLLAALNASTIALQDFAREAGMQTHPKLNWQIVENLNLINKAKGITS